MHTTTKRQTALKAIERVGIARPVLLALQTHLYTHHTSAPSHPPLPSYDTQIVSVPDPGTDQHVTASYDLPKVLSI